jgi:hypothetical protein
VSSRRAKLKIFSGGQTGVDRAALDFAIRHGIPHGGWCPLGRLAEDGPIPRRYHLRQTPTSDYAERTERNLTEADGTLILHRGPLIGGTLLTENLCRQKRIPVLLIDLSDPPKNARIEFWRWLKNHKIRTLNVAGPRESKTPGIYARALCVLETLLGPAAMRYTLQVPSKRNGRTGPPT